MFKCSSGKLLQKGATACHKICVPDIHWKLLAVLAPTAEK